MILTAERIMHSRLREQTVTFKDGTMTTTASKVQTPEGAITPVNVWKKAK